MIRKDYGSNNYLFLSCQMALSDGAFFMIKDTPLPNGNHPISSPICPMGVADTVEQGLIQKKLDSWQLEQIYKFYIFFIFFTISSVKLFVTTVQIFVYKFLFTIVFFGIKKKKHVGNLSHFKTETHFVKKAHSETNFENENMFWGKWKEINLLYWSTILWAVWA